MKLKYLMPIKIQNKTMSLIQSFLWSLILISTLQLSSKGFALTVTIDPVNLNANELQHAKNTLDQALVLLPPKIKKSVTDKVPVKFVKGFAFKNNILGKNSKTMFSGPEINLNRSLLPGMIAGPQFSLKNQTNATHWKNEYQIALGTMIHEIGHVYDFKGIFTSESEIAHRRECQKLRGQTKKSEPAQKLPEECALYSHTNSISDDPVFLELIQWTSEDITQFGTERQNYLEERSPNPYEFKSPEETFAVNLEFFTMDPEYKCRRPSLYNYFVKRFDDWEPYPQTKCEFTKKVLVSGNMLAGTPSRYEKLDFSRLYQIHFLFAGPGEDFSSKWGHAMYRLVFCAPTRRLINAECMKDVSYHYVISFRAMVSNPQLSVLDGLTGKYPSYLFIMPFLTVLHEYTHSELRSLESVPLKLDKAQMETFLNRAIELHWIYKGKYYFLSNNCAVESENLLKGVLPENVSLLNTSSITPEGVLDDLIELKIADSFYRTIPKEAERYGYLFPSKRKTFDLAFNQVRKHAPKQLANPDITVDVYLNEMEPKLRTAIIEIALYDAKQTKDLEKTRVALAYLESLIEENKAVKVFGAFWKRTYDMIVEQNFNYQGINKTSLKKMSTSSYAFSMLTASSYGVPTESEVETIIGAKPVATSKTEENALTKAMGELFKTYRDPDLYSEVENADKNLAYIKGYR